MTDGREVMIDLVAAALAVSDTGTSSSRKKKQAAIVVEALIAESGGHNHIVRVAGWDYIIQHPLTERFEGTLFECPLIRRIWDYCAEQDPDDGDYEIRQQGPNGLVVTKQ